MSETAMPSKRSGRRRGVLIVSALGLGCLAALLVGELAARMLIEDHAVFSRLDRWEAHPRLGRLLKASQSYSAKGADYTINARRLRDELYAPEIPDGTFRIAVVGDSFVFGVGDRDTIFPKVLERRLADRPGGPVEVMGVGMPGYGTVQQNDFLEEFLGDYRFDVVVYSFCVGNDVRENRRSIKWEEKPETRAKAAPERPFWDLVSDHSRLVAAVRSQRKARRGAGERKYFEFVHDRMELARPALYDEPKWSAAWERTLVEIDRMRAFAEERGARFVVFVLPDEYQVDAELRAEALGRYDETDAGLEPDLLQRRLGAALTERGVPVIDPLDRFREQRSDESPLYIPFDTHFDVEGNALAADAIEAVLVELYPDRIGR